MGKKTASDPRLRGQRGAILGLLRDRDLTVAAIARQVGLTANGVRLHLDRLEAEGLVEATGVASGPTKSSRLYGLSAEGRRLFSRAYATFLGALVAELLERDKRVPRGAVADDTRTLFAAVARRLAPAVRAAKRAARLEQALDGLRELGGRPVVERGATTTTITLPQCPLSDLSALHPEMCEFGRALVADWTGEPVVAHCTRGDRPSCRFELHGSVNP